MKPIYIPDVLDNDNIKLFAQYIDTPANREKFGPTVLAQLHYEEEAYPSGFYIQLKAAGPSRKEGIVSEFLEYQLGFSQNKKP